MLLVGYDMALKGTVKAAFYLGGSKAERAAMREEERQSQIDEAKGHAWTVAAQKETHDGIRDFILRHPAAGKVSDIPAKGEEAVIAVLDRSLGELSGALLYMLPAAEESPEMILGREGGIEDDNLFSSKMYLQHSVLKPVMNAKSEQAALDQACAMWDWIYNLVASGEAPHLFKGLKIKVIKGGKLQIKFDDLEDSVRSQAPLWRADMEAAQQKRAAAPKVSVLKK
jgi:hypothetical protein